MMEGIGTDEQRLLGMTARRFLEAAQPIERLRRPGSSAPGLDPLEWRQAAELGWTALLVSESDGGGSVSGNGLADLIVIAENHGRALYSGPLVEVNVVAAAVSRQGTPEQKTAILPGLLDGSSVATWATCELHGHWLPDTIRLEARRVADGFVVDGTKSFVVDEPAASCLLVTARLEEGLPQFLAPRAAPDIPVCPERSLDLARGMATVRFEEVHLPGTALLEGAGGAEAAIQHQLSTAALVTAAGIVGGLDRVFELTVEYGLDRHAFGRPVLSYQALKHRMADTRASLEAAHGLIDGAAEAFGRQDPEAHILASAAKAYVGDLALDVVQDAIQIHGGVGVTWEHDLHLYLRRATVDRVLYGDPREHRERVAALIGM